MPEIEHKDSEAHILISFGELFDSLSHEEKLQLVEHLACTDSLIQYVTEQILDGWTSGDYMAHGALSMPGNPNGSVLSGAIREVALRSSDVARQEIESLQRVNEAEKARNLEILRELSGERSKLYKAQDELNRLRTAAGLGPKHKEG